MSSKQSIQEKAIDILTKARNIKLNHPDYFLNKKDIKSYFENLWYLSKNMNFDLNSKPVDLYVKNYLLDKLVKSTKLYFKPGMDVYEWDRYGEKIKSDKIFKTEPKSRKKYKGSILGDDDIFTETGYISGGKSGRAVIVSYYNDYRKILDMIENKSDEHKNLLTNRSYKLSDKNSDKIINSGNYFKQHPENVLAVAVSEKNGKKLTDRFGKPITRYEGTIENINAIDVPEVSPAPEYSVPETNVDAPEIVTAKAEKNTELTEANRQAEQDIALAIAEERIEKEKSAADTIQKIIPAIDILNDRKTYNKGLSDNDIKAYIWYMRRQGIKMEGVWRNYFDETKLTSEEYAEQIRVWIKQGCLLYFRGDLIYSAFYFQGDIYEKKADIDNPATKEEIISEYGEDVYNEQYKHVTAAYDEIRKFALRIGNPEIDKTGETQADELVMDIVPTSEFAKETYITHFSDGKPFEESNYVAQNNDGKLSLVDAFKHWLRKYNEKIYYKKNTNQYDIVRYYLNKARKPNGQDEDYFKQKVATAKSEGKRLFLVFLQTMLAPEDKSRIELEYNRKYNNYLEIDYNRIPVAFPVAAKYPGNEPMEIRFEKREAVAFMQAEGSGILAYDVGFGKTWSAIMAMSQALESGQAKRLLMVVPNQTYQQWITETKGLLPHVKVNDLYNLSKDYLEVLKDEKGNFTKLPENSISIMTIQGMERLGMSEDEAYLVTDRLYDMFVQDSLFFSNKGIDKSKKSQNELVRMKEKIEAYLAKGNRGTEIDIDELGVDWLGLDEAHAYKNVFSSVKSNDESEASYEIKGKAPTTRAIKGFVLAHYIQAKNNDRNVMLLTATPVTNSPIEVYSMLSFVGYDKLKQGISFGSGNENLSNLVKFFDHFVKEEYEIVIGASLQAERKAIFKGWRNLKILQKILYRVINFKNAETKSKNNEKVNIIRPNKYLLPYNGRYVNGKFIPASKDEKIDITLQMSPLQEMLTAMIKEYAGGKINYDTLKANIKQAVPQKMLRPDGDIIRTKELPSDFEDTVNENNLDDDEKKGVALLRSVNLARSVGVSPYLLKMESDSIINPKTERGQLIYIFNDPDYKEYIETSAKLFVVVKSIKMVKEFFESKKLPVPGQIFYIDRGKEYLPLIKEYLVKEVGFKEHEVEILASMGSGEAAVRKKRKIQNYFNGIEEDEKTGLKKIIPDKDRIKVIIGTSAIREGMNLQMHTLFLYDTFIGWNPTDRIQLEGRAWRQKNKFYNVFIVSPLLKNSMDMFMLQKLEEKTERINTLWDRDGKTNVLGTEEYNPEELKYQLITDPYVIAEMELDSESIAVEEQKAFISSELKVAETMLSNFVTVKEYEPQLRKIVDFWRPQKNKKDKDGNPLPKEPRKIETIINLMNKIVAEQTDKDGKPIKEYDFIEDVGMSYGYGGYEIDFPRWFVTFRAAVSAINRKSDNKAFASEAALKNYIETLREKEEASKKKLESIKQGEYKEKTVKKVIQKQKELSVKPQTLDEIVEKIKGFSDKFTELRADKDAEDERLKKAQAMPPMDGAKRAIDYKSIKSLEKMLIQLKQTAELNQDENGEYTEERKVLHKEIIDKYIMRAKCVVDTGEKPIAVITGGIPGAGKTYFINQYAPFLKSDKILHIDEDKIRADLPEYKGWNASQTYVESSGIARQIIETLDKENCKPDILIDGTMNKPKNYEYLVHILKKAGYDIYLVYVELDKETAIKRTLERYRNTGRYVPRSDIELSYKESPNVFNNIKKSSKGYLIVNGEDAKVKEQSGADFPQSRDYFNAEEFAKTEKFKYLALKMKKALFDAGEIDFMKCGGAVN